LVPRDGHREIVEKERATQDHAQSRGRRRDAPTKAFVATFLVGS